MRKMILLALCGAMWFLVPDGSRAQDSVAVPGNHLPSGIEGPAVTVEDVWPPGEVREYLFHISGQEMGWQWNQLVAIEGEGPHRRFDLNFTLSLNLSTPGQPSRLNMDGTLSLTKEGQPLSYQLNVTFGEEQQSLTANFTEEKVLATVVKGGKESQHMVPYTPGIFVVDNNMIGQWGLMLSLLPLQINEQLLAKIFIPQALEEMDIAVEVIGKEPVLVNGAERLAYVCHLTPIDEICWVTEDGGLLRLEDEKQDLVVTLLLADENGD